ncbi:hypothetical protein CAP31_13160 [Sulfuriferula sp. AH1]|uniref:hypothetical protein n=1 Tax=Sulfuriferula sp. AH1 TaxID=1985873 RepID=UPI000B3BA6A0|nr:hypothetical protein [Sulfuriferula sp. AH1]ARU32548.1 hypothetical protein CAP31_13160 [Sulfuriferula sp. AH1]
MLTHRHLSRLALIFAILLVWTQQLVAAHGVVHPWHDGGSQKQSPAPHSQLCDLCVISALDNVPTAAPERSLATDATHVLVAHSASSQRAAATSCPYHSRAPPVLA